MISSVLSSEIPLIGGTEAALRIRSLARAYGDTGDIVRYYTDGMGGYMALFDGTAIWHTAADTFDEWAEFFSFIPYVRAVRCAPDIGERIAKVWKCPCSTGQRMRYMGPRPLSQNAQSDIRLDDLYPLLCGGFPNMPPFEDWYVDVSHRVRHGACHIACICQGNLPVSSAMMVAEADNGVILGAVVTASEYRHRGLAGRCVLDLVRRFYGQDIYIAPANTEVADLYARLGFCPVDSWAQVLR